MKITTEEVNEIIQGKRELTIDIIKRASQIWPLNPRDFFLIMDDAPNGVKIMRKENSERSKRIM